MVPAVSHAGTVGTSFDFHSDSELKAMKRGKLKEARLLLMMVMKILPRERERERERES